jgi:lambda family phage portal protein
MAGYLANLFNAILGKYYSPTQDITRSYIRSPLQDVRKDWSAHTRQEQVRLIRHFEQTTGIVNRLADLFEAYTVGVGLMTHPASEDSEWNDTADESFYTWSDNADVISRQSFGTIQGLIARAWFVDGECFVIKESGGNFGRPRLRLVESHRVCNPPGKSEKDGVIDGVEIDNRRRPIAYWISETNADGTQDVWTRYDAEQVEHIFEPQRPNQYRGIPFLTPVLRHLHDLDDLQAYEMLSAKGNSEISNILKTETGEAAISPLMAKFRGSQGVTTGTGAVITEERIDYVRKALGGRTVALKLNESLEQHRSDRPGAATMEFWRSIKEEICTGAGIPYVLVYPGSMQGTVYRGALDAADAFFRARSSVMQAFVRRIYAWVMRFEAASNPRLRPMPADWYKVVIHPPRSVKVDIGYDSKAAIQEIDAGLSTYDMIYGPRGLDWREQFTALREQQLFAEGIGLQLGTKKKAAVEEDEEEEPKEEDENE